MPVYSDPHLCGAAQLMLHSLATCAHSTSPTPAQVSAYRLKLPPKRIFLHIQTPEFVEERRQQLDQYLQALLGAGTLGNMPEVGTCWRLHVGAACELLGTGQHTAGGQGLHWATQCHPRQGQCACRELLGDRRPQQTAAHG